MADAGALTRMLERVAYELAEMRPLLPVYAHLLVSALFPIYTGAHASLSRPTSAAKPKKRKKRRRSDDEEESSDEEEEEEEHKMEGLSPTDAILMPVFAGCTLAGLYFLIKWLQNPALLNKILNAYFALFGVFSVSRLVTDALDIGQSIIFPRRHVVGGALYNVHGREKKAVPVAGNMKECKEIYTPLPGFLAKLPLSDRFKAFLWRDRAMPTKKWTIRMYIHRVFAGKVLIGPHGIFGFLVSLAVVLYFNLVDKPWYLTNLMGFGFSYGALQLMSPTTFATGSLILSALFFYDIYFVFYTPMMVTVAKSLDVPIKLMFPRPSPADSPSSIPNHAMLGLGDVVLPGIMIGLALRFDLWLFYFRQQKTVYPNQQEQSHLDDASAGPVVVKPQYFSLSGRWTDHFWTHSFFGSPLFVAEGANMTETPFTFPKVYFRASLVGYVLGMLATLGVMQVWGHAQPALLYLVPGVLGSLWLTALLRGELSLMWGFSEDIGDEEEEGKKDGKEMEGNAKERTSFFSLSDKKSMEREERMKKSFGKHFTAEDEESGGEAKEVTESGKSRVKDLVGHRSEREVFSFSIEAPWQLKRPRSVKHAEKEGQQSTESNSSHQTTTALAEGGDTSAGLKKREGHANKKMRAQ